MQKALIIIFWTHVSTSIMFTVQINRIRFLLLVEVLEDSVGMSREHASDVSDYATEANRLLISLSARNNFGVG